MSTVAKIASCTATACAFNNDGCTAFAITVGGADQPACGTINTIDLRAGMRSPDAHVGACQRLDCRHNADLMCTAGGVDISGDMALCATYAPR
ncbi:DUF1540 domain-containing protein [Corynebacterium sp. YIM 101645]|uniref:DUF1540 domain-containing protein n=1 Tax=Corynebacterium lemuris TaxID=1859292 RepID=A0ABT2FSH8_9CORY|nr:DUF1540 domain-containing protein [Corynebacterium lemuris]MCS5478169.1 DUF1540 domain-containing protein [Corynebacterium lemuris]